MADFQMNYTPGRFRGCPWCHGRGCAACDAEAEAAYKRDFPNGPQPIATFDTNDPADMERCKSAIGGPALNKAFGPDGGGVQEIMANLRKAANEKKGATDER